MTLHFLFTISMDTAQAPEYVNNTHRDYKANTEHTARRGALCPSLLCYRAKRAVLLKFLRFVCMLYRSTRDKTIKIESAQAIKTGLSEGRRDCLCRKRFRLFP